MPSASSACLSASRPLQGLSGCQQIRTTQSNVIMDEGIIVFNQDLQAVYLKDSLANEQLGRLDTIFLNRMAHGAVALPLRAGAGEALQDLPIKADRIKTVASIVLSNIHLESRAMRIPGRAGVF